MVQLMLKGALVGDVWIIWLLILCSVLSVAVMYERWRAFRSQRADVPSLRKGITDALTSGDTANALQLASSSQSVEGRVAAAGLAASRNGAAAAEESMAAQTLQERTFLERRLIILGTLGNNAPFIGLFGTVLGVIKAFQDLAVSGSSGVSVVMAGISSALVATALGIFVAIPAVIANNYFHVSLRGIMAGTDSLSHLVLAHLKRTGSS